MFKKKALTTAVQAAMVVSAATLMQGCNLAEEKSTSKVSGIFEQVRAPKGTVMGVVQDTNGNPLQGVKVVLGSKTTRTNAGGQYQFNGVAVVNTVNLDDETDHEAIQVTVIAPEGYLGATVTVYPQAQIDGMDNTDTNTNDQTGNQVTTFIDGYTASAGTAVLPALNATVTGVLRNLNTGEVIKAQEVALDFESTNGFSQQQGHDGVRYSYATYHYAATSSDEGLFSIPFVPNDSCLRFVVGNYTVSYASYNTCSSGSNKVETNDEVAVINVEDLWVTPHTGGDNKEPFIIRVSGTVPGNNILDKGVTGTGGVQFTFSEPLAETPDQQYVVEVVDATNSVFYPATATMSDDQRTITVATVSALPVGVEVHYNFVRADLADEAGNAAKVCNEANQLSPFACDGGSPIVESIVTADTGVKYLRVVLNTWSEANLEAEAVTNLVQLNEDTLGTNDDSMVQALNDAFKDVYDGDNSGDFQGLNSVDDDDDTSQYGYHSNDAADRLDFLLNAINGAEASIDSRFALISFTPSDASYYKIEVNGEGDNSDGDGDKCESWVDFCIDDNLDGSFDQNAILMSDNAEADPVTAHGLNSFIVTDASSNVRIGLNHVNPGDDVEIRVFDDLGYEGTVAGVRLRDNVAPTTVINGAYGAYDFDGATGVGEGSEDPNFGNGGELSNVGSLVLNGTPTLNLTHALLDNMTDGQYPGADENLGLELLQHNTLDESVVPNVPFIDDDFTYDAKAYTVFAANLERTVGIAFSEDIILTGTPSATVTGATLGPWLVNNDVLTADDGGDYGNSDLVNVTVSDIIALANNNHGQEIDFANVVTDTAGTRVGDPTLDNGTTTAKVILQDFMPPMIVSASYNGRDIEIQFNEDVNPQLGDQLGLYNQFGGLETITISQATVDAHALAADQSILTIGSEDWNDDLDWDDFTMGDYIDENSGNVIVAHFGITFDEIEDMHGNSWDANAVTGWDRPDDVGFAIYNAASDFVLTEDGDAPGLTTANATFTVTYIANHPMDLAEMWGGASTETTAVEADIPYTFNPNGGGTIVDVNASLNAARTTLTITVELTGNAAVGATFDLTSNLVSDWDSTQSDDTTAVAAP